MSGPVPALVVVTDDTVDWDRVLQVWCSLDKALPGKSAVLSVRTRKEEAKRLTVICKALAGIAPNQSVVVSRRLDVARAANVGVHLPSTGIPTMEARAFLGEEAIILRAAHDEAEARKCHGSTAMLLSPVREPLSHASDRPVLTGPMIVTAMHACTSPAIAMGGLGPDDTHRLRERGFAGIAMGSRFFLEANPVETAQTIVGRMQSVPGPPQ